MKVAPLKPDELCESPIKVPDELIEWINKQIQETWNGESAHISIYEEFRYEWVRPNLHPKDNPGGYQASNERAEIRSKAIIRLYREAGWAVEYDSSIYNLKFNKQIQRPKVRIG